MLGAATRGPSGATRPEASMSEPAHPHHHHHHRFFRRFRHSHETAGRVDPALESSRQGLRALWISLIGLAATAAVQALVFVWSGSVALLADTVHNAADALTAVPLGIAFLVGRRAATRAFTYGFGRAEDIAGLIIVVMIAGSGVLVAWQGADRLLHPQPVSLLGAVFAAGLVGFLGNELVARYRIRVGRRIGSAALVADGQHARADGFTSLGVVAAATGAWLGWDWADPVVALVIAAAIGLVLRDAAREVFRRLLDAVDPATVDLTERVLRSVSGVRDVARVRLRWIGHRLHAEADLVVDADLSLRAAHAIAADAEHQLTHQVRGLVAATVHTDPDSHPGPDHHPELSHRRRGTHP
jgi:cation diffusion facilitator family transporter